MKEKKIPKHGEVHKTLPQLQLEEMYCVFCGGSSDQVDGGYFKEKFVCRKCNREMMDIDSFLFEEAAKKRKEFLK